MKPNEPDPQPISQGDQSSEQSGKNEPTHVKQAAHFAARAFLFKLSLLANGAVGAVLAVPVVGYLLGPALRKKSSDESWVGLGLVSGFPEGETRLATFRNPVTTAWDGQTGDIPCWVRRISGATFQVFAINCAHLGCPVRWFSESKSLFVPVPWGEPITKTVPALRVRRSADSLNTNTGSSVTLSKSAQARCLHLRHGFQIGKP